MGGKAETSGIHLAWRILLAGVGIARMVVEERIMARTVVIVERIPRVPQGKEMASGPSLLGIMMGR
jgi:hypothetical protein